MAYLEPDQLDIDTSDVNNGTLSKAFKFANRTRLKVERAFSFNKTPSKLKRAVSSMMSPFGSSTNLTPASQLAQMKLASYNNINVSTETCYFWFFLCCSFCVLTKFFFVFVCYSFYVAFLEWKLKFFALSVLDFLFFPFSIVDA